ncbi:uncharacterized protein LOC121877021 [Homarus americanus]|uniref:Ig-like domain-containing protein n=1 Tax=Homarus americanus TaxID=6706 RepID=A0A8J5JJR5_HOMAM|nr:uncharacterized protein LOC121877021 [Homarus americanus]KAG7159812.1 hypothetical protein Hamer_G022426 [Homarus americanus]
MSGNMAWLVMVVVFSVCCCREAKAIPASGLLKLTPSKDLPRIQDGNLPVPLLTCSFVSCDALNIPLNSSISQWDYYIGWDMPQAAKDDPGVFVIGNKFQMPQSHLVLTNFTSNLTGKYTCQLFFRKTFIDDVTINLSLSSTEATRKCNNHTNT